MRHSHNTGSACAIALLVAACAGESPQPAGSSTSPDSVVEELLAADRTFARNADSTDLVSAISAMLAPDVIMPAPGGVFADGIDQVVAALRTNPDNATSRAEWLPSRGGISGDGQHGFTFGYMTAHRPDSSKTFYKYLAYWVKRPEGWRVQAYKRGASDAMHDSTMAPSLPARIVPATTDSATIAHFRESLAEAERSFSRDAQNIGLGPAFQQYGNVDAVNMGGPDGPFLIGVHAVAAGVGANSTVSGSPVYWAPDHRVIVASSGDFGITFGFIRQNHPSPENRPPFPFFTVWRRPATTSPWRYIAE